MNVPVTLIGGYLGSGKTTLINRLLAVNDPAGWAVVVNDFGAINVDAELLAQSSDGKIVSFSNGCICCSMQDDFGSALERLRNERHALDHVIVEASGVATPANLRRQTQLPGFFPRGCLVAVDATNYRARRNDKYVGRLVTQQVEEADWLYVNREPRGAELALGLRLDEDELLGFSWPAPASGAAQGGAVVTFETLTLTQRKLVSKRELNENLAELPDWIERVKGFVSTPAGVLLVQQAARRFEITPLQTGAQDGLVFIVPSARIAELTAYLRARWPSWRIET